MSDGVGGLHVIEHGVVEVSTAIRPTEFDEAKEERGHKILAYPK